MSASTKREKVHGSMANKVVASDLQEERDKCNFDQKELYNLFTPFERENRAQVAKDQIEDPELHLTHTYYEMTVEEKQKMWMKRINHLWFKGEEYRKRYFFTRPTVDYFWMFSYHGQAPLGLHATMFMQSLDAFTTEE